MKRLFTFFLIIASFPCSAAWYEKQFEVMGTLAKVELELNDPEQAGQLIQQVVAEMQRIDQLMSPFIEQSELSRINRLASQQGVKISSELFFLLEKSLYYSRLTNGAFDISFSSLGYLYDYRKHLKPTAAQKESLVPQINYHSIELNKKQKSVKFASSALKIDLGGIAKGYAVDRCIELLIAQGVKNAFISAGGDSRVIGKKNNRLWYIGIRHPRDEKKLVVNLPLEEIAISTSGDYERFFIEDGVRYHHIIDPKTGDSARNSQSVTILAPLSVDADALSTSIFILGAKRGLELINGLSGVSAIIIDADGQLYYSDDLTPSK